MNLGVEAIALSRSLLDETQAESDLRRAARSYVKKGRELLLERHRAGAGGVEVVSVYSTMMDQLIRYLFSKVSDDFIRRYPSENPRCTVVAQGGYGRGELNPYSDIDLLFLYSWKISSYVEAVTERLLYTLWDLGHQVGHSCRSLPDCLAMARTDFPSRTSMQEARYVAGGRLLFRRFQKVLRENLYRKDFAGFLETALAERAPERWRAGVEEETADASQAYARFGRREPTRYSEGWLPG